MIRGSVDVITTKLASGWIYSDGQREPLSVEVVINDQVVGTAVANLPRPDLVAAGFGSGKCGFEIRFKNEIDSLYLPFVQVRLAATDLELRRWAGAGFRDYFVALYQRYPRAGRSASVYGGLWTDRTDAAALLKGRTDIGIVALILANRLARFIQDGALVVEREERGASPFAGKSTDSKLIGTVAVTVFDQNMLEVLRAIFDDNPVTVRADVVDSDDPEFFQMSAIEKLPSPAECLGIIFPSDDRPISVEVVRGGHRFAEFLPDGLSRWSHTVASKAFGSMLSPDLPIDRHHVPPGSALVVGAGALCRIRAAASSAIRALALPARQSLLRFHMKAPIGELTHDSGARIWI